MAGGKWEGDRRRREGKEKKRITRPVGGALQNQDERKKEERAALLNLHWIEIMAHIKESPSPSRIDDEAFACFLAVHWSLGPATAYTSRIHTHTLACPLPSFLPRNAA